jgi:GMP synthase (glutamine-hydrolysing)
MPSCMALPLAVLTTGQPVPLARERRGKFFDMIRRVIDEDCPGPLVDYDATTDEPLPGPREVAGVIVTGSPARVATRDPWMLRIEQSLREYAAAETPVFGICFGHQLLGSALGGKAGPNPNGREIGTERLELLADDDLLQGVTEEPVVVMTHLDSVTELPPGAVSLARTRLEPNAVIRFAPRVWGVQFHPEMDVDLVGDYIEDRRDALLAEGLDPDGLLARRVESGFGRHMLRRFVREQLRR